MTPPRPEAIRLVTQARDIRGIRVPLGLRAWSPEAAAVAVLVDAAGIDVQDLAAVALQVPPADTLPERTPVVVLGLATTGRRSWLPPRPKLAPLATRVACAALLVRGYTDIGAGPDAQTRSTLCWGWVPPRRAD